MAAPLVAAPLVAAPLSDPANPSQTADNGNSGNIGRKRRTVRPVGTVEIGAFPEPAAFTPDGRYLYVGNFADQDFSILKVSGDAIVNTGKRFRVPGHPASARMEPSPRQAAA